MFWKRISHLHHRRKRPISLSRNSSETMQSRKYLLYGVYIQCIVLRKFVFETFFSPQKTAIFAKIPLSFRVLTRSRMLNRRTSQSKKELIANLILAIRRARVDRIMPDGLIEQENVDMRKRREHGDVVVTYIHFLEYCDNS